MRALRGWLTAAALLVVGTLIGCSPSGPKQYRASGAVTLDGQPIPYGEVLFTPDGSKNNTGSQGIAEIHDGKYDTNAARGKGMGGGPTVLRVNGMSGPGGKTLCEYELKEDLPQKDTIYDIKVPKGGAAKSSPEI